MVWDIAADILGIKEDKKANERNIAMQKEFAQKGIQWKVSDAKGAGIHPLYALGAQTHSPSFSIKGQGDAIRDIGSKLANRELHNLQKESIKADIVLKQARASEVARRTSTINSQQDADITGLMLDKDKKTIISKAQAKEAITTLGARIKVGKETPKQFYEEEYGEIASEVYGLQKFLKDRDFFGSVQLGKDMANLVKRVSKRTSKNFSKRSKYNKRKPLYKGKEYYRR